MIFHILHPLLSWIQLTSRTGEDRQISPLFSSLNLGCQLKAEVAKEVGNTPLLVLLQARPPPETDGAGFHSSYPVSQGDPANLCIPPCWVHIWSHDTRVLLQLALVESMAIYGVCGPSLTLLLVDAVCDSVTGAQTCCTGPRL